MPKEKKNEFPIDLMGGEALDSKGKKGKGDGFNGFSKGSSKTARVSLRFHMLALISSASRQHG
jgi:hypothetical protein